MKSQNKALPSTCLLSCSLPNSSLQLEIALQPLVRQPRASSAQDARDALDICKQATNDTGF